MGSSVLPLTSSLILVGKTGFQRILIYLLCSQKYHFIVILVTDNVKSVGRWSLLPATYTYTKKVASLRLQWHS
jgi:hypothetical protein